MWLSRFLVVPVLVLASAPFVHAAGKLDIVGKFEKGGRTCNVATYIDGRERVGLIGVIHEQRMSIAFRRDEWDTIIDLFQKACRVESPSWQFVDIFKETGTSDPTLMFVSAGPGVQIVLQETDGTVSVVVSKGDCAAFEKSLQQVKEFLATQ